MELFNYYCLDWAIFAFMLCQLWMVGSGLRAGFLFGIGANISGFALGFVMNSPATSLMNVVFMGMNAVAYSKWSKKGLEKEVDG